MSNFEFNPNYLDIIFVQNFVFLCRLFTNATESNIQEEEGEGGESSKG